MHRVIIVQLYGCMHVFKKTMLFKFRVDAGFLKGGASQAEMTDVQSCKPLLKNCLICMHPHLLT